MEVKIVEVGLRDGLQNEAKWIPTELKVSILNKLIQAGLKHLEVTSFVHPKWIPQLADADELLELLPNHPGGTYRVLVPNERGLERALSHEIDEIAVFLSSSESHNKKNVNRTIQESLIGLKNVIQIANNKKIPVRGYVSTVFGCPYEGNVPLKQVVNICETLLGMGVYEISLGDTIGIATPNQVKERLNELSCFVPLSMVAGHFHDTRGMGLVNAYVALECGVNTLDTSFGGLGGCPYAPGASGNLATEDLVYMLNGIGIETGIHLELLCELSMEVEQILGKVLPSKVLHSFIKRG